MKFMCSSKTKWPATLAVAAVLAVACLCPGCAAAGGDATAGAAAVFGSHVITEDEITQYTQDYRAERDLSDDEAWRNYLVTNNMTVKTWREEAIRQKADRILIVDKATELGITVGEDAVQDHIAQDKEAAGVDPDDEAAWEEYLHEQGQTPEGLREAYEYTSLQQQVFSSEIEFTGDMVSEMCNDYLRANLADQVVRRYSAISFDLDDREGARALLDRLAGMSGDELTTAFERELAARAETGQTGVNEAVPDGDIGWNFLYDEYTIDPDLKLRKGVSEPGVLYGDVLEGEDALRIVMCTETASFVDIDYDALESESLKEVIAQLARVSNWTALCLNYTDELEQAAGIKVAPMPDDLPYYVEIGDEEVE